LKVEVAGTVLTLILFAGLVWIGRKKLKHEMHVARPTGLTEQATSAVEQESECLCEPCKTLEILYQNSKGQMTIRDIDVIRVYQENQQWYVEAFCHLLTEQRIFKVDQIKCLKCPKHCSRLINSTEILEYLTKHISF
jgi:hypothetical protein